MNSPFFKSRILLLATALAAGAAGAQSTDTTQSALPNADAPVNSKPAAGSAGMLDSSTSATAPSSEPIILSAAGSTDAAMPSNDPARSDTPKQIGTTSSNDSTQVSASASATNQSPLRAAGKTPRASAKHAAKQSPADNPYRAELRHCVQMTGAERDSCLDRAIENHPQG